MRTILQNFNVITKYLIVVWHPSHTLLILHYIMVYQRVNLRMMRVINRFI